MASSENTDSRSAAVDVTKLEAEYKKDKARAEANFSRAKNKLLSLLEHKSCQVAGKFRMPAEEWIRARS